MDVLDRAFAPATPGSRPGGLSPLELRRGATMCGAHPKVAAADIVEVSPPDDVADVTSMAAAEVLLALVSGRASLGSTHAMTGGASRTPLLQTALGGVPREARSLRTRTWLRMPSCLGGRAHHLRVVGERVRRPRDAGARGWSRRSGLRRLPHPPSVLRVARWTSSPLAEPAAPTEIFTARAASTGARGCWRRLRTTR